LQLLAVVIATSFLLSSCSDVIITSDLGLTRPSTPLSPRITVVDNRATNGIELVGLRSGPSMDDVKTIPPVAQAIRMELNANLKSLRNGDSVSASVVRASCQIANHLTKGSASFELRVSAQFRASGQLHSKMLVAGMSHRDFKVDFKGVPVKEWCSAHFLTAAHKVAANAATYYGQLVGNGT
jgi:hypothetical protein